MNNYFTQDRLNLLSSKITDPINRNKIHDFIGLNKKIRRPFSKKKMAFDRARYVTVFRQYGLFKSMRPGMVTGSKNESGQLIHISNNPMFYRTVFNLNDEISTVQGIETIKIPSDQDVEFFELVDDKITDFTIEYSKPVGYKETDARNGVYYVTDHGILTSLSKDAKNIISLDIEDSMEFNEIKKDTIDKYSVLLSKLPTSYKRAIEMFRNDEDFVIVSYNNMDVAERNSKYGGAFYDDLVSRKFVAGNKTVGHYIVEAVPMSEEMTNSQIKRYLRKKGVPESEFEHVLGIDRMTGKNQREYKGWLNNNNSKSTRYFIVLKKGELLSGDSWQIQYALNMNNSTSNNKC